MALRFLGSKPAVRKPCSLRMTDAAAAFLNGVIIGRNLPVGQTCLVLIAARAEGRIHYSMRLAEAASVPEMVRMNVQGVELALDPASLALLDGAEIGFIEGALTMANPNAQASSDGLSTPGRRQGFAVAP